MLSYWRTFFRRRTRCPQLLDCWRIFFYRRRHIDTLFEATYETKQVLCTFPLEVWRTLTYPNDCILFKEYTDLIKCMSSWYKKTAVLKKKKNQKKMAMRGFCCITQSPVVSSEHQHRPDFRASLHIRNEKVVNILKPIY